MQPDDWPPFRIEQISDEGNHPRWQFHKKDQDDWLLQYPSTYPLYRALDASPARSGTRLSGVSAFVVDVCAEGIIEWAMEPLDVGNASRLDELLGGAPAGAGLERWEDYCEKMVELARLRRNQEQVDRYGHLVRECARPVYEFIRGAQVMPVKIWDRTNDGALTSRVETSRSQSFRGERYRADAETLDEEIDRMLDHAVALSERVPATEAGQQSFVKRWSVGRALFESRLMESDHLETAEQRWLWLAIARKCRLSVRSDGSLEESWRGLIPRRELDPSRIELDVFAMGMWLQEQEIETAMASFCASLTNAIEIHHRGAIRSKNLRDALALWFW